MSNADLTNVPVIGQQLESLLGSIIASAGVIALDIYTSTGLLSQLPDDLSTHVAFLLLLSLLASGVGCAYAPVRPRH